MAGIPDLAAGSLLSPMILFFVLGLGAGWLRSDLAVPEAIGKALSLYLMMSIGMKGGIAVASHGIDAQFLLLCLSGVALGFLLPVLAYVMLRRLGGVEPVTAAAIAAHYGSISIVTYVTATTFLRDIGVVFGDQMVAIAALMETPAIVTGLLIARFGSGSGSASGAETGKVLHEVLLNGSVVLLMGALLIGWFTGPGGAEAVAPFLFEPFKGVLCLFLLDMGLLASRRLLVNGLPRPGVLATALLVPLAGAAAALALAWLAGASAGNGMLFAVLGASASYIAVPAAMRIALPRADGGLAITLSLAVTFPFNIVIGLPLYWSLSGRLLPP